MGSLVQSLGAVSSDLAPTFDTKAQWGAQWGWG
jgi:hypothetical protein